MKKQKGPILSSPITVVHSSGFIQQMALPDGRILTSNWKPNTVDSERSHFIENLERTGFKLREHNSNLEIHSDVYELRIGSNDKKSRRIVNILCFVTKKIEAFSVIWVSDWEFSNLREALDELEPPKSEHRKMFREAADNAVARKKLVRQIKKRAKYSQLFDHLVRTDSMHRKSIWIPGFDSLPFTSGDHRHRLLLRLFRILQTETLPTIGGTHKGKGRKAISRKLKMSLVKLSLCHFKAWKRISKLKNPKEHDFETIALENKVDKEWLEDVTKDGHLPSITKCDSRAAARSGHPFPATSIRIWRTKYRRGLI